MKLPYGYFIVFNMLLQNSFKNLNCCKVGQIVTEELKKKLDGWKKQLDGGQRLLNQEWSIFLTLAT